MSRSSVDEMFSGQKSKYALVIAVAKRAREITEEMAQTSNSTQNKTVNLAISDFKEHRYDIVESDIND